MKKSNITKAFMLIYFLIICSTINAQTLFNKRFGSPYSDEGSAIAKTIDSGFVVAGTTYANGAGGDIFLMKLNRYGEVQWQKDIFGVNLDNVMGIYQLSNGNFILGGNTYSYGSGCWDAFEVMLDSTGTVLWSKAYGDVQCNYIFGFSVALRENGFIDCGSSSGSSLDGWLYKTDQNGLQEWSKYYGNTSFFYSVKPTFDGGYLAVGSKGSISILKIDSLGNPIWFKKCLGVQGVGEGHDLVTLNDGTAVITGMVSVNNTTAADVFIMKIDHSGNIIWFKTFGFTFYEFGLSIKATFDSGFIIAGYTNSIGHGDDDALLLKTDMNGDLLWAKTYGDVWQDRAKQVQVLNDSGFVFIGESYNGANSDSSYVNVVRTDKFGNACDYIDWWPIQQNQNYQTGPLTVTATDFGVDSTCHPTTFNFSFSEKSYCLVDASSEIVNSNVIIYPNPVSSFFTITGLPTNSLIKLFTLTGELILSQRISEKSIVDLSDLKQGVYILQCEYGIKKIVKI